MGGGSDALVSIGLTIAGLTMGGLAIGCAGATDAAPTVPVIPASAIGSR
jgi:hypothetical protein